MVRVTEALRDPEAALSRCIREIVDFVDAEGWDRPPAMFALVRTAELAAAEPDLLDQLEDGAEVTPLEQPPLPEDIDGGSPALDEFLATTSWPESVAGCALVQEIVILPPGAENEIGDVTGEAARESAFAHPEHKRARLFAGVLRDGPSLALLQLEPDEDADPYAEVELLTHDELAPDLVHALYATLDAEPDDD
ncbi:PPA1309 family protein [Rhodococcus sp. HNM0569]|uniref:PPA1309 family protein n=1 Tax=Rhodococcus sp. HNM0569 TaxID=2716340 RepID=UPI00146DC75F|nr:PPA1309 family protein [Rhodococcus sp. HNM0569]NLU81982.1 hypothetical protein [Rhodococcus sp. HNM0569]